MKRTTREIWALIGLRLLLFRCNECALGRSLFEDGPQLYEGSRCALGLENGSGSGVCRKVVDCPVKMREIETGNYSDTGDRCGFSKFDEIVCCDATGVHSGKTDDRKKRRADVACERYKEAISRLEDGSFFHTVVFNGVEARVGEYPHMAALGYAASGDDDEGVVAVRGLKYVCGGTLVSERHVVTAAHCASNVQGLVPVEVLLGATDLTASHSQGTQAVKISRITKHPEYRRSLNYHDIAVLELESPVKFSAYVKPTCLPTEPDWNEAGNDGDGPRLDVLGWGAVDLEGTRPSKLLKATGLKLVDRDACSRSYENNLARIPNGFDAGMICVVDPNGTRRADTCWGDSGGPLLISAPSFPPLVGVTSFGQACGGTTPGVYASVHRYLDWIENLVWPYATNSD